jgi:hypothetical protein
VEGQNAGAYKPKRRIICVHKFMNYLLPLDKLFLLCYLLVYHLIKKYCFWYTFGIAVPAFFKVGEGAGASRSYLIAEHRTAIPEQQGGPGKAIVFCTCLDE